MLPPLNPNSALFLDIDGTLIDLAATPQAVTVPPDLPAVLRQTQARLRISTICWAPACRRPRNMARCCAGPMAC
jgi:trehalose-6-phosphatase